MAFPRPDATRAEIDAFLREQGPFEPVPHGELRVTFTNIVLDGVPQDGPRDMDLAPQAVRDLARKLEEAAARGDENAARFRAHLPAMVRAQQRRTGT